MWPDVPADLSAVTDDELSTLEETLIAAFRDASPDARTAEEVADLEALADSVDRVRNELSARADAADALSERVAGLALRVVGQDEPDAPAEPADEPAPSPTEPPGEEASPQLDPAGNPIPEVAPGAAPANPTPNPNPETGEAPAPTARAAAGRRASLAAMAARLPARATPRADLRPAGRVRITSSPDIPGYSMGHEFRTLTDIAEAMLARRHNLGQSAGPEDKIPVARFTLDVPEERMLRTRDSAEQNMAKIQSFSTQPALVAAGGLCAPVAGYYDQFVIAEAHRPVRDALPTFGAERGGIRFNPPPKLSQITQGVGLITMAQDSAGVTVTDGVLNSTTLVTSATAAFTAADVGRTISGTGIPAGTTITAVASATNATMSQAATATASSVSITIGRGSKATFVVSCPAITEVDVQAIYMSIQFGNVLNRTFPEQVAAWTKLAAALWARTADQALLDGIAASSTAVTSAGLVGGAREVLARVGQACAGYRSRNRMPLDAPLTLLAPQWVSDMMQADLARTFSDDADVLGISDEGVNSLIGDRNVNVNWYSDSKTGGNQVIGAQGAGVLNQFPALAYMYLFAEGSFLRLDAGTLDLGLVRDSTLNAGNNFRMFTESFENVAFVGVESLEIALTAYPDGTYGAAKTVTTPIVT